MGKRDEDGQCLGMTGQKRSGATGGNEWSSDMWRGRGAVQNG